MPISGTANASGVPAPVPAAAAVAPIHEATPATLAGRYATTRQEILAAEQTAAEHGDQARVRTLRTLAGPTRQVLTFDGRDGGRTAEVVGDLASARRIAVLVPGADTSLDTYARFRAGAVALQRRLGSGSAVIAWLGYRTPGTVSPELLTVDAADRAAPALRRFVETLAHAVPAAEISLVGHSYGTVVCARAAAGLPLANVVLTGSPGTGYDHASELRTTATVWAGRGTSDWIARVPHGSIPLAVTTLGFGADPMSPAFGAHTFAAGDGGHSDYLRPGSTALRTIARILAGGGAA
ncbi:alpha/beta hydrolase family protein [Flindersiella endophytica]